MHEIRIHANKTFLLTSPISLYPQILNKFNLTDTQVAGLYGFLSDWAINPNVGHSYPIFVASELIAEVEGTGLENYQKIIEALCKFG